MIHHTITRSLPRYQVAARELSRLGSLRTDKPLSSHSVHSGSDAYKELLQQQEHRSGPAVKLSAPALSRGARLPSGAYVPPPAGSMIHGSEAWVKAQALVGSFAPEALSDLHKQDGPVAASASAAAAPAASPVAALPQQQVQRHSPLKPGAGSPLKPSASRSPQEGSVHMPDVGPSMGRPRGISSGHALEQYAILMGMGERSAQSVIRR